MRSTLLLVALAPAVLAEPQQRTHDFTSSLARRSPAASIPEIAPREQLVPLVDPNEAASSQISARHVLQVRSEGTLGQTPWIGMAIGLTCTALAAVMLG